MFLYKRADRVKELLQEETAEIIRHEVKDPRIGFVTITRVELSDNLRSARIFISPMGNEKEQQRTYEGICSAAPFIRSRLGRRMRIKFLPELIFNWDHSQGRSDKINRILHTIEEQKRADSSETNS